MAKAVSAESTIASGPSRIEHVDREHSRHLWRVVLAYAGDQHIAGDAVSEAFRFEGKSCVRYMTDDGLASDNLTSVVVAPDGTVWFGTSDSGVSRFVPAA